MVDLMGPAEQDGVYMPDHRLVTERIFNHGERFGGRRTAFRQYVSRHRPIIVLSAATVCCTGVAGETLVDGGLFCLPIRSALDGCDVYEQGYALATYAGIAVTVVHPSCVRLHAVLRAGICSVCFISSPLEKWVVKKASGRYGRVCPSNPPNSSISISFHDLWHALRRLMGGKSMGRLLVMGPQGNVVVDHVDDLSDLFS